MRFMLQKLFIQNYAIIDQLEINFSGKLNVITGETGAGKSIIVGALGLILGARADSTALVNKEKKCFVEGTFDVEGKKGIREFLEENDLETNDELIIRREINTNGKSRAFVNDTPVTLSQLSILSSLLVDLHKQFDALELGDSGFQREVLDALADHAVLMNNYQEVFRQWQSTKKEWEELNEQKLRFEKEVDYNQFQFNELEEAGFKENELEQLETQLKLLNDSEGIKAALSKAYDELKETDTPIVQRLKILVNQLQVYASHPEMPPLINRLESVHIELQDIAEETDRVNNHVSHDPAKVEQINERLSLGYRLLKKHGAKTTNDLLVIQTTLGDKLQVIFNIDDQLKRAQEQTARLHTAATQMAAIISEGRIKQIKPLEQQVNGLLAQVGMQNAKLKVRVENDLDELNFFGADGIEFLFDANKTGQYLPLRKIASGGELSRLMLCIKSLVAQSIDLPTLIFDEVDTGISGEAARQVGIIIKGLAAKRQVICITHQPQIAGKADAHFLVYKEIENSTVKTNLRLLTLEERITAVAKMLSGEKPTAASIQNAKEMVMN
jgi:DNA repair protein RecN (Recombination protein N)